MVDRLVFIPAALRPEGQCGTAGEHILRTFTGFFRQGFLRFPAQQALGNQSVPRIFGVVQKILQLRQGLFLAAHVE